uniref:Uncharacterized protein n=1 Tax=Avena sativa TaxID=4498 RepID=A0ACD5XQS8_AVESA
MHDLMHELARNVSTGECARIDDPVQLQYENDTIRYLYVVNIRSFSADDVKKISHFKNLRAIIIYNNHSVEHDIVCTLEMILKSSKSLRLFHSKLRNTFKFSDKFGNLKHLRYIYVFEISPDMICGIAKLYHLMVLRCGSGGLETGTHQVRYLGNLERLRYVSYGVRGFGNFGISRLTSLQELHDYRVGGRICNEISAIRNFRDLRELVLGGLDNVESYEEAKNAKLKEKQHLDSLFLEWSAPDQIITDDLVLDHLEPHVNIRVLVIRGYDGPKVPFWIENHSVKNLVSLRLICCINWEYLPSLGGLVLLKLLQLDKLPKLRQIGRSFDMASSSSMDLLLPQSLYTLEVTACRKLMELPILPPGLVVLKIHHVRLTKLPRIGKISGEIVESKSSKLACVSVTRCRYLTSLEGSLLEQKLYMGTLQVLTVDDCIHLESMSSIPFEEMKELREFTVKGCPKLRTLRDANDMLVPSSLRELTIAFCGDVELPLLGPRRLLTNLSLLTLQNCSSLVSLPSADVFKNFGSMRYMYIKKCENLSSLGGLGSLPSRIWLEIKGCSKLIEAAGSLLTRVAFGSGGEEEHLVESASSLQITGLDIDLPSLLLLEPLKSLRHTKYLSISNGSEMESLPERWLLQNGPSLQQLNISKADSLKSLTPNMQDLCSLVLFHLFGAAQLQSLPYMPPFLKSLILPKCHPDLEKKIRKHGSPEWDKIAPIPCVRIGGLVFRHGKI